MESGHRFDAQTLHSFIQAVFRQMGSEEQEAKLVADHLIAANLAGHDSHGIGMIPRSEERRVGKECRSRWSPYH